MFDCMYLRSLQSSESHAVGSQNETSSRLSERAEGVREEARRKRALLCKTKSKGDGTEKPAVLSLFRV